MFGISFDNVLATYSNRSPKEAAGARTTDHPQASPAEPRDTVEARREFSPTFTGHRWAAPSDRDASWRTSNSAGDSDAGIGVRSYADSASTDGSPSSCDRGISELDTAPWPSDGGILISDGGAWPHQAAYQGGDGGILGI